MRRRVGFGALAILVLAPACGGGDRAAPGDGTGG